MFLSQKCANTRSTKAQRDFVALTESQPTPATLGLSAVHQKSDENWMWRGAKSICTYPHYYIGRTCESILFQTEFGSKPLLALYVLCSK